MISRKITILDTVIVGKNRESGYNVTCKKKVIH